MKAAFRPLVLLAALVLPACRASSPPARNTLPRRQPLTEATTPENAEPSRKAGLELVPDTTRRDLPQQP
ncbi:hypothetical protein ACFST9_13345 [Hymenobacter monticola]|uniref:Uncharacterized protein n=1 Tax=Hymenobacter monticola TaxID=1705399 RepID=A0ABY4BAD2_9BACT|nr:hypothetical protein [Hymenobacter monticola]UOE34931.1 hypothetical protein MTP16_04575 [Hymenobacter monticola]